MEGRRQASSLLVQKVHTHQDRAGGENEEEQNTMPLDGRRSKITHRHTHRELVFARKDRQQASSAVAGALKYLRCTLDGRSQIHVAGHNYNARQAVLELPQTKK